MEGLPAGDITLAFLLARYQGMRRIEIFELRWTDVDWERSRIETSEDGKTGWRECPIFPEVLPYLRQAFDDAPEGATKVIRSFTDVDSITPIMHKHISAVIGKKRMWPRVLQQLRKTRRNELEERFPSHVVNEWIGHDAATAKGHYLEVMPEHWERATLMNGGNISANPAASTSVSDVETVEDAAGCDETSEMIPPSRVELLFLD